MFKSTPVGSRGNRPAGRGAVLFRRRGLSPRPNASTGSQRAAAQHQTPPMQASGPSRNQKKPPNKPSTYRLIKTSSCDSHRLILTGSIVRRLFAVMLKHFENEQTEVEQRRNPEPSLLHPDPHRTGNDCNINHSSLDWRVRTSHSRLSRHFLSHRHRGCECLS